MRSPMHPLVDKVIYEFVLQLKSPVLGAFNSVGDSKAAHVGELSDNLMDSRVTIEGFRRMR